MTARRLPLKPCEAINDFGPDPSRRKGNGYARGDRCTASATHAHDGRKLCWLHFHAARNVERLRPLEFVT